MAPENSEATLQAAFLQPVRTVLIVDDEFPTYGWLAANQGKGADGGATNEDQTGASDDDAASRVANLAEAQSTDVEEEADAEVVLDDEDDESQQVGPFEDDGENAGRVKSQLACLRAAALWEEFRRRGWNCDVDDGRHLDPTDRRIGEVDLLILDYELDYEGPEPALRLVSSLAGASHASLAVVYTKADDLRQVRLQVAGRLWACRPQPTDGPTFQAMKQVRDELDDAGLKVDEEVALIYLRRGSFMVTEFAKAAVKKCRGKAGIKPIDVVRGEIESYLKDTFGAKDVDENGEPPFAVDGTVASGGPLWIWCNNLFVAFVSKQKLDENGSNEGDRVIKELLRALSDWSPDGLTMTLSFARGRITRGGFRAAADALANRELHAGLLYFANAGDSNERSDRVKEFYRLLLSGFAEQILEEVAEFGSTALPGPPKGVSDQGSEALIAWAIRAARIDVAAVDLFHELNKFLATDSPRSHAGLGTVFMVGEGEQAEYWICVTPACDMVPRQPSTDRWEGKIDPLRAVVCMRGVKLGHIQEPLTQAERGKTVFLTLPEPSGKYARRALQFLGDWAPVLEHFYLVDRGRLDGNQGISAYRVTKDEQGAPQFGKVCLRVLTQLRDLHGNRFLRAAAEHVSRIGVDFVDFVPLSEDAKQYQAIRESLGRLVAQAKCLKNEELVKMLNSVKQAAVVPSSDLNQGLYQW